MNSSPSQIKYCTEELEDGSQCAKPCMGLVSHARIESSEWYCKTCHKSYPMDAVTAMALKKAEIANQPRQPQR